MNAGGDDGLQSDMDNFPTSQSLAPESARFFRRLVATWIDMIVFCSLCAILAFPVASAVHWSAVPTNLDEVTTAISDSLWVGRASGVLGMWIALWWCYFVVGWGLLGATPGKWVMGLRVTDHKGRCPIGTTRAVMRLFGYAVSSITLGVGHLLAFFRPDRRALHDILAGTRVVRWRDRKR